MYHTYLVLSVNIGHSYHNLLLLQIFLFFVVHFAASFIYSVAISVKIAVKIAEMLS